MTEIISTTEEVTIIVEEIGDVSVVVEENETVVIVEMEPGVPGPQGPPAPYSSTLMLYPTTTESDIQGYYRAVSDVSDADYDSPAVDVPTGAIGTDTLISSLVSDAGIIVGSPGVVNLTVVGDVRKVTGAVSTNAHFYFKLYKRDSLGAEVLIGTSDTTDTVTNATYEEFSASLLFNDGAWTETDRVVLKFYGTKVGGGVDPTYEFQFGGDTPVRVVFPVPVQVLLSGYLKTDQTIPQTITANTVAPTTSDKIYFGDVSDSSKIKEASVQSIIDLVPPTDISGKEDVGVAQGLVNTHESTYDHSLIASALQPGDNISELINDVGYITDLSGLVPYTGATGDVDLGTHNLDVKEINQYATSEYDGPTLGPELLDDTGWTSTGWTGSWSTGWTSSNPGSPTTLSRTMTLTAGHTYLLSYTIANPDGWGQNITFYLGGSGPVVSLSQGSYSTIFTAVDSSDLIMTPDTLLDATIFLSVKEITPKESIFNIYDSTSTKVFEIQSSTSALNNTFAGLSSGAKTLTGYENVSFGGLSLFENMGGYQNTSIGYKSSYSNQSGYRNLSLGAYSLYTNTLYDNIALGAYSMYLNNNSRNVSLGAYSMYNNLGGNNVAIGYNALYSAVGGSGGSNVAIGLNSLQLNTTGQTNVAIGPSAMSKNTTGADNVAIGNSAGSSLVSGNNVNSTYSVFIGPQTKASVANGVNEIVIGYNAVGNGSNTVTLGHTTITSTYLRGDLRPVDGKNWILGTTTGMKIGTATNQKIGFFNSTPVVQQVATTDLGTVLSNLGLRAAGTAYPITTSGAVSFTGNFTHNTGTATFSNGFTIADARNIVLNTTTGTKIGTATTQKLGLWNVTPVTQPVLTAYTSDTESVAYTGIDNLQAGTVYATVADLNTLRTAYENLRIAYDDLRAKLRTTGIVN